MSLFISTHLLEGVWHTFDPFLFCVHHFDKYPAGDGQLAPKVPLSGRNLGQDFSGKDGFSMYHGTRVPGFPQHPHRGFETVTIARQGYIDHSDSLGAKARFGLGDAQWLTAGRGIVHCEMFPLLKTDNVNTTELFQIWLNLPQAHKMVSPYFSMLWANTIPELHKDGVRLRTYAGAFPELPAPPHPPPDSWASMKESDVAIWTIALEPHASVTLPKAKSSSIRALYFFEGESVTANAEPMRLRHCHRVQPAAEVSLKNGKAHSQLLMLQAKPIGEPVVSYGPFVMNSREEIQQAFADYQKTQFGGWPYRVDDPNHGHEAKRFAIYDDGRKEEPGKG